MFGILSVIRFPQLYPPCVCMSAPLPLFSPLWRSMEGFGVYAFSPRECRSGTLLSCRETEYARACLPYPNLIPCSL